MSSEFDLCSTESMRQGHPLGSYLPKFRTPRYHSYSESTQKLVLMDFLSVFPLVLYLAWFWPLLVLDLLPAFWTLPSFGLPWLFAACPDRLPVMTTFAALSTLLLILLLRPTHVCLLTLQLHNKLHMDLNPSSSESPSQLSSCYPVFQSFVFLLFESCFMVLLHGPTRWSQINCLLTLSSLLWVSVP